MKEDKEKFACMIYPDVFDRLDTFFKSNESFGRILRAAMNYGFKDIPPALDDPTEQYACSELTSIFDRNRDSYNKRSRDGQIATAIQYATDAEDLTGRLKAIDENITNYEISQITQKWKKRRR